MEPEVRRLNFIIRKYIKNNERDCLLIWLTLKTGARATEILNIEKKHLNRYDKSVQILGIKGSKDREIPLPPMLFEKLWKHAPQTGRIFPISYQRFVQIWGMYRPVKKKLHSLRHTFAITLLQKSKDIRMVQYALGHTTLLSTTVYTEYLYTRGELRKGLL